MADALPPGVASSRRGGTDDPQPQPRTAEAPAAGAVSEGQRAGDAAPLPRRVPDGWLAMKELRRRTGATRATVAHYLALGVLPQPRRTARNMAYYDPASVEIIGLVHELQGTRRLSLEQIARMLREQGAENLRRVIDATAARQDALLDLLRGQQAATREELLAIGGIDPGVLDGLEAIGLVRRASDGSYDALSRQICDAVGVMRRAGLDERGGFYVTDLGAYRDAITALVRMEVDLFNHRLLGHMAPEQADRTVRDSLDAAEAMILGVRKRLLLEEVEGRRGPTRESPAGQGPRDSRRGK